MPVDYPRLRARIAGLLLGSGAALGAVTVATPHSDHASDWVILASCGLVVLVAGLTWRFGRWFADWTVGVLMLAAAASITFATAIEGLEGTSAQDNAMLYLVPVLYAACFLPRLWALLTPAACAGSYAWLLAAQAPPSTAYARWLTTTFVLIAGTVAVRVLRNQLFSALEELARRAAQDPLTGVLNRRAFDERLALELVRTRRNAQTLAVLMCDIDHFKRVNDEYGHATGDRVLLRVTQMLRSGIRGFDAVGRIGGEELAVMLPDCTSGQAFVVAERLRAAIAESGEPEERATVSIGVSDTTRGLTAERLLASADAALYAAKHAGRNCVREAPAGAVGGSGPEAVDAAWKGRHLAA